MSEYQSTTEQAMGPQPIIYDYIKEYADHASGIAHFDTPALGRLQLSVQGQLAGVERYAKTAILQRLDVRVLGQEESAQLALSDRAYWHGWLQSRCKALHDLIDKASLEELADGLQWAARLHEALTSEEFGLVAESEIDLAVDRLCEFQFLDLDERPEVAGYELFLDVAVDETGEREGEDPTDVYRPVSPSATGVSAGIIGAPDLFLFRGGLRRDEDAGPNGTVSATGGAGLWSLHVVGVAPLVYTLSGSWIFTRRV
ncbi:MAG: hypothetical protein JXM73_14370 [Anaerolineae bacterium]|nr:hypothetical protein [Anaerolineae bacterium]